MARQERQADSPMCLGVKSVTTESDEPVRQVVMPKCVGLLGELLGHKFKTFDRYHDFCQRCGMPAGGYLLPVRGEDQ